MLGELEKRLTKDAFRVIGTEHDSFSGRVLKIETVLRLLQEAKKEFPLNVPSDIPKDGIDKDRVKDVLEWFEKWFENRKEKVSL